MLDSARVRLEALLESVAREEVDLALGEPRHSRIGALHQEEHELFSLARLSEVQRAISAESGEGAKRLRFLLAGLADARGTCAAAGELDEYMTWRATAHIAVGETRVPLGGVAGALAAGPDAGARHASEVSWLEAIDAQQQLLEGAFSAYRRAVEELGYGDFPRSVALLLGVDLEALATGARQFLADSEALYFELLDWHLPRIAGVTRPEATAADALRLERAPAFDPLFSGRAPDRWARGVLGASGFDPFARGRLRLYALPEQSRAAVSSVHFVRVPDEVVVLHTTGGGRAGAASLLRGLGAAAHGAYTRPDLPFEFRRLGDGSIPFAFGVLFESLLSTRSLLQRQFRASREETTGLIRLAALTDLYATRASAARFLFEHWWHADPDSSDSGARYAAELGAATGLRHDPRASISESVPPFRSVHEIRARQLGELLAAHLRDRCDEDWNRNPRSVSTLVELMSSGRTYTADEMAVQLGAGLSFDPLTRRVEAAVG